MGPGHGRVARGGPDALEAARALSVPLRVLRHRPLGLLRVLLLLPLLRRVLRAPVPRWTGALPRRRRLTGRLEADALEERRQAHAVLPHVRREVARLLDALAHRV